MAIKVVVIVSVSVEAIPSVSVLTTVSVSIVAIVTVTVVSISVVAILCPKTYYFISIKIKDIDKTFFLENIVKVWFALVFEQSSE